MGGKMGIKAASQGWEKHPEGKGSHGKITEGQIKAV